MPPRDGSLSLTTTLTSAQACSASDFFYNTSEHQYEPYTSSVNMVASSRSSLRRPNLRGNHQHSRSSSPVAENTVPKQLKEVDRPKRTRIASVSGREQLQKRRRIATKAETDEISIPLRGKGVARDVVLPTGLTRSIPTTNPIATQNDASDKDSPLQSPTPKPQYDQIKRIEEKARASIRGSGPNSTNKDDRRKLRSEHGGTRSRTELAQYFPAFEEMLSLEPPNPGKTCADFYQ